ncbi:MAG TPA: RNA polymerase sigma factor [Acholeplasmataceae bacterium]|jgi:RNA polymerase sigma-70 factor (ECF subfamily)|nr:RNA polymerase sigma factor [Acholeplasmataceae bacterium]
MVHPKLDDFIIKYLEGDVTAFDTIYEETKKSVYLSIYSLIREQSTIEDLMQETYMKAINYLEHYRVGTNFQAWISRIARNTTINFLKKRNREEIIDPQESLILSEGFTENRILDFALDILSGLEKEIIVYRIILNYTFKEISEILDIPLGTVFWNYQKAISKIKKEI